MVRFIKLLSIIFISLLIFTCTGGGDSVSSGCTDVDACNYDLSAINDDGSCQYFDECDECGGDGLACATTFSMGLNGDPSDFLDNSGEIDQESDKAINFKQAVAGEIVGADPNQIQIIGIEPIESNLGRGVDDGFHISFIFIEISGGGNTISVEDCVSELIDLITTAVSSGELSFGEYTISTDDIAIANLDEDAGCPFDLDECL